MDAKLRARVQLNCLYEMFRDRVEENVVYIVYSENEGKIDTTIDQLMSIAQCSFTGHHFETRKAAESQRSFGSVLASRTELSVATAGLQAAPTSSEAVRNLPSPQARPSTPGANTTTTFNHPSSTSNNAKYSKPHQTDHNTDHDSQDDQEEQHIEDIEESIERLQKEIDDLVMEKRTSHDKASQYSSRKMYPVTSYYSELASQLYRMIERKTNQLVELLLRRSENSDHIDLHGLNPVQARLVVNELLKVRQHKLMIDKQGEASIDIITGWGKHSLSQGQRVRPTIVALLREKGLKYTYVNKGALRVTIHRL